MEAARLIAALCLGTIVGLVAVVILMLRARRRARVERRRRVAQLVLHTLRECVKGRDEDLRRT